MGVLKILDKEFLESLPDDDPEASFAMIVERCENYLEEKMKLVDPNESDSWYDYRTEQYTSMRTIISAAQRLAVEPFSSLTVPTRAGFERSNDFQEFKHDVDHYLTQFVLDRAIREKRESVVVAPAVKDRLRAHIQAMRSHIDGANLSDSKRAKLHAKLTEFEQSLEKDRIPIFKMARFLIEILSISANVVGLAESHTMAKLTANIMETFAEAKAADDESRRPLQIEHQPSVALPPKRAVGIKKPRETFDLDDEIPF